MAVLSQYFRYTALCALAGAGLVGRAQTPALAAADSGWPDLADLGRIEVTIATRRATRLEDTAAAVFVITADDIARQGATTIPDALRYTPGMDVASIDSTQWSVSARGLAGQYANLMLVMIDGRSVFNPAFGGVAWQTQDVMAEDLERIEVVRGPGGALWGANAVNGVINVVTKSARDTQGSLLTATLGTFDRASVAAREGFRIDDNTYGRVYVKYFKRGSTTYNNGAETPDDWWRAQAGFRIDHQPDAATTFTVQGDVVRDSIGILFPVPNFTPPDYNTATPSQIHNDSANLLARWSRQTDAAMFTVRTYYDYFSQTGIVNRQWQHTFDLDGQADFNLGERHAVSLGAGFRNTWDLFRPTVVMSRIDQPLKIARLFSVYAQDEVTLVPAELFLTLGAKLEHNDFSGLETAPSARLRWRIDDRMTAWAAVSRAVAPPGDRSRDFILNLRVLPPGALGPGTPATLVQLRSAPVSSEDLVAYELGWRYQPTATVSVDVALFDNRYSDLVTLQTGAPDFTANPPVLPVVSSNRIDGMSRGAELSVGWQPLGRWRLFGTATWYDSDIAQGGAGRGDGKASPRWKYSLRSSVELTHDWSWELGLRHVDGLESLNVSAYTELDLTLTWRPNAHLEVGLGALNLLHANHLEYPRGINPLVSEIPRSIYGKVTWRY